VPPQVKPASSAETVATESVAELRGRLKEARERGEGAFLEKFGHQETGRRSPIMLSGRFGILDHSKQRNRKQPLRGHRHPPPMYKKTSPLTIA